MTERQNITLVLTTVDSRDAAEKLASRLLESKLAACVSLFPVTSRYEWKGRLERAEEIQLLIKTSPNRAHELERRLGAMHPYDTPEVLILDSVRASESYVKWVTGATRAPEET